MTTNLLALCWPAAQLGECLSALVRHTKIGTLSAEFLPSATGDLRTYITRAAERLACEVDIPLITLADLETSLRFAVPGLLQLSPDHFLAVVASRKNHLILLSPSLQKHSIPLSPICRALREPYASKYRGPITESLAQADLGSRQGAAVEAVLLERIGSQRFEGCWTLRPSSGAGLMAWLRQAAIARNATALLAVHLAQYLIWLLAWAILGNMSFTGRMDKGTLTGWALLLATAIPFQLLATWLQGLIAVGTGGLLKRRLLAGALKLHPDEIRHSGIGTFLAQALEAGAVESLALGGGIAGLLSVLDLVVAGFLLGGHAILLVVWFGISLFSAFRFMQGFAAWTASRFALTGGLIESMVGHRTRLTQQHPSQWHQAEDRELDRYHHLSAALDRRGSFLISVVPRGWLSVGLASTMPAVLSSSHTTGQLAILIGGVLLAFNALSQLVGSFSEVAAAAVAWKSISPLFHAASRPTTSGALLNTPDCSGASKVLEADRLTFRYRQQGAPVLDNCSVTVRPGDRILLGGPSGGGKTTLASVLAGVRGPETGLLLSGGLDRATLGSAGWADRVISVPQFHENHVLTETLAFNLLLGRTWPPSASDLQDAEEVCRRLGLGELLDRMPNGLLQMVGEGGWQLSHGERTRVFMARALLQKSDLLILDESFGALDPENMQICLEYTLERANALMVIAHP